MEDFYFFSLFIAAIVWIFIDFIKKASGRNRFKTKRDDNRARRLINSKE